MTFRNAAWMAGGIMALFTIVCVIAAVPLVGIFSNDPAVIATGGEYLRIISWNYVASGLVFVASSMFQAMGNTVPSLISSGLRNALVTTFVLTASRIPGLALRWIWYVSVASVFLQRALSMTLLRREFTRRL